MPIEQTQLPLPNRVTVVWQTSPQEGTLADLREAEKHFPSWEEDDNDDDDPVRDVFLGTFVPQAGDLFAANLVVREHQEEKPHLFWVLQLFLPAPGDTPPQEFIDATEKIGGQAALRSLILRHAGEGSASPPIATYQAEWKLDDANWLSPVLAQQSTPECIGQLAKQARVEQVGYRLSDGVAGLQEVSVVFHHEEQRFFLQLRGRGALRVVEHMQLPYTQEMILAIMGRLIAPRG